jgi:hypothetical protein
MANSILGKGIGYLVQKQFLDWKRIQKIANQNGIYSAADVAKLIRNHSPIKRIGDVKMQWAKRIYTALLKNPKASFYEIVKQDLEKLEIILGKDPKDIHWGAEWEKVQRKKKIKVNRSAKSYSRLIEHHRKKYSDFMKKEEKLFLAWYEKNKHDNSWDYFVDFMHKAYMNPGKEYTFRSPKK